MATAINRTVGIVLILVAGFMPYLAGYTDMSVRPTEGQLVAMKWILIAVQGTAALAALAFLWFYPITRHRAESTRRVLDERHRGASAPHDKSTHE